MSLIEQAAKRLEELRRAGVDIPEPANKQSGESADAPGTIEAANAKVHTQSTPPPRKPRTGLGAVRCDGAPRTGVRYR
jgi:hypothetical protein